MKTVFQILSNPQPTPRDVFITNTAIAIASHGNKTMLADAALVLRALDVAAEFRIFAVPKSAVRRFRLADDILAAVCIVRRNGA